MVQVAPEVAEALAEGRPVVALESAVIAHGLPYPANIETALAMETAVRAGGAVPATIGVSGGALVVGMDERLITQFGESARKGQPVAKLGARDLAAAAVLGWDGATTVGATARAAALVGIQVLATGGVGGVHRGAAQTWDISGDLMALARYPVMVVCAGVKAILDIPATLEWLEMLGVPVVGWRCSVFPAFYTADSGRRLPVSVGQVGDLARLWAVERAWGGGGLLVVQPPPEELSDVETAIQSALAEAEAAGVHGAAVTPYLLAKVSELTDGKSLEVNTALLRHNALTAAAIACGLARPPQEPKQSFQKDIAP
ncbi:MAG: pseudouridine-5'-phosphate glycosidase [Chloracidobacterium sp.]|nr:pseudouridine-5'-phosphate glycosidase [Chloracidobacterium sp.]MDW8216900.1 pseudouridine-5'-phosphate glycosidase [Acidobacteriota bacterium]